MEVASLYATLRLDDAQYKQGMTQVRGGMQQTGDTMEKLNKQSAVLAGSFSGIRRLMVAAFSLEAIRRTASALISTTSALEQYRIRLRSVIEDQREADATFQRIKDWAALNPVNTDEAIAAFVLLKAAAVDNTEDAVKAVGNLSAVMGRDMRDVSTALISLNTLQLRRLGIIIDQTGKTASVSIGKTRVEVEKNVHLIRAALIDLIQQKYGTAMDKAKNTFKGILDTWGGQLQNFRADIMGLGTEDAFNKLTQSIREASDEFQKWQESEGYSTFISNAQEILKFTVEIGKSIGSASKSIVGSDIGTTIIKWGLGLKVVSWGFKGLIGLAKSFGVEVLLAGARHSKWIEGAIVGVGELMRKYGGLKETLAEASKYIPWRTKVIAGGAAAGIAAGAGVLAAYDDWTKTAETLSERRGLGLNDSGLSLGSKVARDEARRRRENEEAFKETAKELKEAGFKSISTAFEWEQYYKQLRKDIEIKHAQLKEEKESLEKRTAEEAAAAIAPRDRILKATLDIWAAAAPEFERADKLIKEFGLSAEDVYKDVSEGVKEEMKEVLDETVKLVGPAGLAAISEQLSRIGTKHPELKALSEAIGGVERKVKSAKEQIKELADEMGGLTGPINKVTKALKDGLMPEGAFAEAVKFVQDSWGSITGKLKESLSLEFSGQSKDFLLGIQRSEERGIAESLGFAPVRSTAPTTRATTDRMTMELSDSTIAKLRPPQPTRTTMPVQVNVYQTGFQVKDEAGARRMGRLSGEGVRLGLAGAAQ